MRRVRHSLAFRLWVWIGGMVLAVFLMGSGWFVHLVGSTEIAQAQSDIQGLATTTANKIGHQGHERFRLVRPEVLQGLYGTSTRILMEDRTGKIVFQHQSVGFRPPSHATTSPVPSAVTARAPVRYRGHLAGWVVLQRNLVLGPHFFHRLWFQVLLATGGVALIVLALLGWVLQRGLRPVRELEVEFQNATLDRPLIVPHSRYQDEIAHLSQAFQAMFTRLADGMTRERQFLREVSHELRTPLTVIRGYARTLTDWGQDDPSLRKELITGIMEEVSGMERTVEAMLMLSFLQQSASVSLERIDSVDWFDSIWPRVAAMAPDRVTRPDNITMCALKTHRSVSHQILRVLVENALTHSDRNSAVTLDTQKDGHWWGITVSNRGSLPEAWREFLETGRGNPDPSRRQGHFGLGLNIAYRLAFRIGGRFSACSGDHTHITFWLPISQAEAKMSQQTG